MEEYFRTGFPNDEWFSPPIENDDAMLLDDYCIAQIEKTLDLPITELMTYGASLHELAEYVITPKTVCEFSYELQNCIFDLFPRWYIAQTPYRSQIYPDIQKAADSRF